MASKRETSLKSKSLRGFELNRVIGKGSYGEVWLARHSKDKKHYVLKKINLERASTRERKAAEQEAQLLSKLRHPNIVTYKDSFQAREKFLYIAMQYCEGGDLYTWLKERKGQMLEERQIVEWFIQIAMALQYLHERDILHRDLKTQNIFLTKNKIIKVGDLGIARVLENSSDMATTLIGTPYYMSPELFSSTPYNQKSDVWALGCCVYEMTTLRHAFNARDMNSLAFKILSGKLPPMPKLYSNELVMLIKSMLHQQPDRRPSVNRLLRNSYIKKNIAIFLEETKQSHKRLPSVSQPATSSAPTQPAAGTKDKKDVDETDFQDDHINKIVTDAESMPIKKSVVSRPDLNCIPEDVDNKVSSSSGFISRSSEIVSSTMGSQEETVIPKTVKEVKPGTEVKKGETKEGKTNIRPSSAPTSNEKAKSKHSLFSKSPRVETRPLPPPPKLDSNNGVPQKSTIQVFSQSSSSSSCSSKDGLGDADTPRSLPNELARKKRRERKAQSTSSSCERSQSSRIELKRCPLPGEQESGRSKEVPQEGDGDNKRLPHRYRQPSIADEDSVSSPDEESKNDGEDESEKKKNKEMKTLARFLHTTLRNNMQFNDDNEPSDSTSSEPSPQQSKEIFPEQTDEVFAFPTPETLVHTARLAHRIQILEQDCIQGVGKDVLFRAIQIFDNFEDEEVQPHLVELMGAEKVDQYAGKIWQLKFCKDTAN